MHVCARYMHAHRCPHITTETPFKKLRDSFQHRPNSDYEKDNLTKNCKKTETTDQTNFHNKMFGGVLDLSCFEGTQLGGRSVKKVFVFTSLSPNQLFHIMSQLLSDHSSPSPFHCQSHMRLKCGLLPHTHSAVIAGSLLLPHTSPTHGSSSLVPPEDAQLKSSPTSPK